jgi:hypothetical protein
MRLAIVLLRDAMAESNRAAVRELAETWMFTPDMQVVPQAYHLLVTPTDLELAQTLVEAATYLKDPAMLTSAQRYAAYVQEALPG